MTGLTYNLNNHSFSISQGQTESFDEKGNLMTLEQEISAQQAIDKYYQDKFGWKKGFVFNCW